VTTPGAAGVIELGEDRALPARRGGRGRRPRSHALPAVLLVAVGLLLVGRAEPVRPRLPRVAELPVTGAAALALAPDTAFIADRAPGLPDISAGYGTVSAYRLPGGARRWQTRVPLVPQRLLPVPEAGVVLATALDSTDETKTMLTVALEAGTGRVLWSTDSGLAMEAPAGGDGVLLGGFPGGAVRWVDLRSGRSVWSRPLPVDGAARLVPRSTAADPARLLMTRLDGTVDVVAERTGAVLASGSVGALDSDAQLGGPREPPQPSLQAVGGRLLVFRPQQSGPGTVTAYDLGTLRPLWTSTRDFGGYGVACGALICLPGTDGLAAIDPDDGSVVWADDRWNAAVAVEDGDVLAFSDRLDVGPAVLAAGTGRVRVPLDGWSPVDDQDGHAALVTRPSVPGSGRAWFAALPPGHSAPQVLGDLPRAAGQSCQVGAGLLACGTSRGTVQVWRYRNGTYLSLRPPR
jgi:outer membrane protein assembly factor BamB